MSIHTKSIVWNNETLIVCNERVLYWEKEAALLLSDLHIGKAAYFRKNGIAMPTQIHEQDLNRLAYLIHYFGAKRIIIVGDMVHANDNMEVQDFMQFIQQNKSVDFLLVKGNHDRMPTQNLLQMGLSSVVTRYFLHPFVFSHEPIQNTLLPQITGHIHPGVLIPLPTRKTLRLPAFIVTPEIIVLPAFSKFTGLDTKSKFNNAIYYACYEQGLVEIV